MPIFGDGHVGLARNLLHQVAHKALRLAFRTRIWRALFRNRRADDVQLIFGLLGKLAIGKFLDELLIVPGSFIRFFFGLVG